MTSLNGPGFSISLLNVTSSEKAYEETLTIGGAGVDLLELIDAECDAWGWRSAVKAWENYNPSTSSAFIRPHVASAAPSSTRTKGVTKVPQFHIEAVRRACRAVIDIEPLLTKFDTVVGDGDCGLTWEKGAKGTHSYSCPCLKKWAC